MFGRHRPREGNDDIPVPGWATAVGARPDNQDRCACGPGWAVVCDGIGGHPGGGVAAQVAVDEAARELKRWPLPRSPEEATDIVSRAAQRAHAAVQRARLAQPDLARMGTTLTAALCAGPGAWVVGSLGDSPSWLVSATSTRPLTEVHTVVSELQRLGLLSPDEVDGRHPGHHVLSRWVGMDGVAPLTIGAVLSSDGDRVVVASDGLAQGVPTDRLHEVMAPWAEQPLQQQAELLVKAAIEGGARDNVTVAVLVACPRPGPEAPDDSLCAPGPGSQAAG